MARENRLRSSFNRLLSYIFPSMRKPRLRARRIIRKEGPLDVAMELKEEEQVKVTVESKSHEIVMEDEALDQPSHSFEYKVITDNHIKLQGMELAARHNLISPYLTVRECWLMSLTCKACVPFRENLSSLRQIKWSAGLATALTTGNFPFLTEISLQEEDMNNKDPYNPLTYPSLPDQAVSSLSQTLPKLLSLRHLCLSISDHGLSILAKALCHTPALEELDLVMRENHTVNAVCFGGESLDFGLDSLATALPHLSNLRSLHLTAKMSTDSLVQIGAALCGMMSLTSLSITHLGSRHPFFEPELPGPRIAPVVQALYHLPHLHTLKLIQVGSRSELHPEDVDSLVQSLMKAMSKLTHLTLEGIMNHRHRTPGLMATLGHMPELRYLRFRDVSLTSWHNDQDNINNVLDISVLNRLPHLKYIELPQFDMDVSNIEALLANPSQIPSVHTITFHYMEEAAILSLIPFFGFMPHLHELNFSDLHLGKEGARSLADAAMRGELSNLQILKLSSDWVKQNEMESLACAMTKGCFPRLKQFSFSRQDNILKIRLSRRLCVALAKALSGVSSTLESVCLKNNDMTAANMSMIIEGLSRLSELRELDLNNNDLWGTGVNAISAHLGLWPKLQVLKLANNKMGSDAMRTLTHRLHCLYHVHTLDVSGNLLGHDGVHALMEYLKLEATSSRPSCFLSSIKHQQKALNTYDIRGGAHALRFLSLKNNGICEDQTVRLLLNNLHYAKRLHTLELANDVSCLSEYVNTWNPNDITRFSCIALRAMQVHGIRDSNGTLQRLPCLRLLTMNTMIPFDCFHVKSLVKHQEHLCAARYDTLTGKKRWFGGLRSLWHSL